MNKSNIFIRILINKMIIKTYIDLKKHYNIEDNIFATAFV
jgi:hypothetical protein